MQIGELIRGYPEPDSTFQPIKGKAQLSPPEILPIRESDKPYQFDFPKFNSNDIQAAIKKTLKDAVLGKLFNSASNPRVGLLDGFNDNAKPVAGPIGESSVDENPIEQSIISYSYSSSFSESFNLDIAISDNQLALNLTYSKSLTESISYANLNQGIEYSSENSFEKSLSLSIQVDLGSEGESLSLISYDLSKSSNRTFTESFSGSLPIDSEQLSNNSLAQPSSYDKVLASYLLAQPFEETIPSITPLANQKTVSDTVIQEYLLGLR